MKHKILSLALAAMTVMPAAAQELRTTYFMQTSNYRHEMNPALLDSAYIGVPLVLGNLNLGLTGNMGLEKYVYKMQPGWQGYGVDGNTLTTFMHPNVDAGQFLDGLGDKNRLALYLKYNLASVAFKGLGGTNLVELNLRSNTMLTLPKTLFEFMKTTGAREDYKIDNLGLRTENYLELGLGHSHQITDKLIVGAKVKFLIGAAYSDLYAERLNLHLNDEKWAVDGDIRLSAALMKSELEYEDADKNYVDPTTQQVRRRISGIDEFKPGLSGFGLAFDLGATYQVMPDLKVSASVTDLGFISWFDAYQASNAESWTFDGFKNPIYCGGTDTGNNKLDDQMDALTDDLENLLPLYEDATPKKTDTRALAATINLGAEYTLPYYRNLRFGFLYTSRIAGKYSWHQGMLAATVRPVKWFEASWNVAATSTGVTSGLVLDFHAKHFNFFLGTDRFFGKLSKQGIPMKNTNASVSLGMSIPM